MGRNFSFLFCSLFVAFCWSQSPPCPFTGAGNLAAVDGYCGKGDPWGRYKDSVLIRLVNVPQVHTTSLGTYTWESLIIR